MPRRNRRWLLLLPPVLLLALLALGIYAYAVLPPEAAALAEARARAYYLEQALGGPWDSVGAVAVSGHFAPTRAAFRLRNRRTTWCVQVEASGRRNGRPVAARSEWVAWQEGGSWSLAILNVPWSSLTAAMCH